MENKTYEMEEKEMPMRVRKAAQRLKVQRLNPANRMVAIKKAARLVK